MPPFGVPALASCLRLAIGGPRRARRRPALDIAVRFLATYAANLHGAIRPTKDIDVTPATTEENLTRLVAALRDLNAGIRVDELPEGLPFDTSPEALRGMKMLNLRTPHGDMDLTFSPSGFPAGYDNLIGHARPHIVDGVPVHVAALADIITGKTEAARQKDFEAPGLAPIAGAEIDSPGASLDRGYS
jgi:hypothetical protein